VREPFVITPRRFVDACRSGEISVGAFHVGHWIACRADFLTGRYIVAVRELLAELGRSPGESKTLRRQLAELRPRWIDFGVSQGQRKPWVITLTGLAAKPRCGHDLDKHDLSSVQVTEAQLGHNDDDLEWEAADSSEELTAATSTRLGQLARHKREEERDNPPNPPRGAGRESHESSCARTRDTDESTEPPSTTWRTCSGRISRRLGSERRTAHRPKPPSWRLSRSGAQRKRGRPEPAAPGAHARRGRRGSWHQCRLVRAPRAGRRSDDPPRTDATRGGEGARALARGERGEGARMSVAR
jgi:hypothetical protein